MPVLSAVYPPFPLYLLFSPLLIPAFIMFSSLIKKMDSLHSSILTFTTEVLWQPTTKSIITITNTTNRRFINKLLKIFLIVDTDSGKRFVGNIEY